MDFDGLLDRYEKPIYNLIYRMVGDLDEAADLTQETFVAAYRSFSDFKGEASVYTWLYRIAVNKCKNSFKANDRRRSVEVEALDGEVDESAMSAFSPPDPKEHPHKALQQKELRVRLEQAIIQLPIDYRVVFILRDLQGLSYKEIADAAEISVDVVRTRLARARRMLRQKLEPYLTE